MKSCQLSYSSEISALQYKYLCLFVILFTQLNITHSQSIQFKFCVKNSEVIPTKDINGIDQRHKGQGALHYIKLGTKGQSQTNPFFAIGDSTNSQHNNFADDIAVDECASNTANDCSSCNICKLIKTRSGIRAGTIEGPLRNNVRIMVDSNRLLFQSTGLNLICFITDPIPVCNYSGQKLDVSVKYSGSSQEGFQTNHFDFSYRYNNDPWAPRTVLFNKNSNIIGTFQDVYTFEQAPNINNVFRCRDSLELVKMYNNLNGPNWDSKWDLFKPIDTWDGITLWGHGLTVYKILLVNNNLKGNLYNFDFPDVEDLNIYYNQLSGTIPNFDKMPRLGTLNLYHNQLSGTIPNFDNLPRLHYLQLRENQLSGMIPNFDYLPNLEILGLSYNLLTGNIPNFDKLPNLTYLTLNENQLSGTIPNFDKLPNLTHLTLNENQLSGTIPNFDNLSKLEQLYLHRNKFSGCFPNSLKRYCRITYNFSKNPLLPWKGDFSKFCMDSTQIGAPCDDGNPSTTNDKIDVNCECHGIDTSSCRYQDSLELVKMYNSLDGPNWTNKWDLKKRIDEWHGIKLSINGCVEEIELFDNNLSGKLYDLKFNNLISLSLSKNRITGSIPNFKKMPKLKTLYLYSNLHEGKIPNFDSLPSLSRLALHENQFDDTIPNFKSLINLETLQLSGCNLKGKIPLFENLKKLTSLELFNNKLIGIIPDFSHLLNLSSLDVSINNLEGCIPSIYKNWCSNKIFNFAFNLSLPWKGDQDSFCLMPNIQIGAPCDDGDSTTIDDKIDASCKCRGVTSYSCRYKDSLELVKMYDSLGGPNWWKNDNWKVKGKPIDTWHGISLNSYGCVSDINLGFNNLSGNIYNFDFQELQVLNLSYNLLYGVILNFNKLLKLKDLSLQSNYFTGTIPDFDKLPNLENLFLFGNDLEGQIPNFNNFPKLKILSLSFNNLDKSIPDFDKLSNLMELSLGENSLSGTIPNFNNLPKLEILALNKNQLTGKIPNFDKLLNLKNLIIRENMLSGQIPSFKNLLNLKEIDLRWNELEGQIPNFNNFINLEILLLRNNQFEGSIPNLDNLNNLRYLSISDNKLKGTIPKEIINLPNLYEIYLNNNQLSGCFPDSLKRLCRNTYDFSNNPKLPWQGDFTKFCMDSVQIGAPCDDGDSTTVDDRINADCSCGSTCTSSNRLLDTLICHGQTFTYRNKSYIQSAFITDSLTSYKGCDSIIQLNLTILPDYKKDTSITICKGSVLRWEGKDYGAGKYVLPDTSIHSCDSSISLTVIEQDLLRGAIRASICVGTGFSYRGKTYYSSDSVTIMNPSGCDSIITIDLKLIPPTQTILDTSICEGSSIVIAGKTYQSSMRDTLKLSSSFGCDSMIYLNIQAEALPVADAGLNQFIPCDLAFVTLKAASAGQGLSYFWKDSTGVIISTQDSVRIGNAGLYILELQNKMGCSDQDSIYVSASDKPVIDKVSTIPPFCTGESSGSISINQVTKGLAPYRYSLYQNNQAIITLPLGTVFNDLASGSYEVEVRDANNCLSRQTVILPDPDPATLQVYLDTSGLQNQKAGIPLLLKSSLFNKVQGRVSYTWTIDGKDICITNCSSQFSHSFEKSAWVRVCAEDSQCSSCDSSYILIQEEKKTDDPDIITDESDGFKFKDLEDPTITGTELWIATRHGTIVYNQKNYQCCGNTDLWKGQNQDGSILPTASYYYVFKIHYGANKKDEIRKGTITWIR